MIFGIFSSPLSDEALHERCLCLALPAHLSPICNTSHVPVIPSHLQSLPHFSCVQQPSLWPRARSMFGEKYRTLNPVFSSFKLSACLWLEPPRRWRSHWWFQPIDCELPLQMNSSVKGIWRFHRKTRSSSRRKDVHERQRAPNILLYSSLTRQLFGSFPRHIDIYRRIKVLIWLSSGKSHVWHFHRVFTRPPPQSLGIQKQAREII